MCVLWLTLYHICRAMFSSLSWKNSPIWVNFDTVANAILQSKMKAFAEDKINENKKLKFDLESGESNLGKGENAGYQHFLLFPQCFPKLFSSGSLKCWIVW